VGAGKVGFPYSMHFCVWNVLVTLAQIQNIGSTKVGQQHFQFKI
jgi:hypothetical protein